jgi:hypothetical protein
MKRKNLRRLTFSMMIFLLSAGVNAQNIWRHGRLKVAQNGCDLCFDDGYPFFWLGDTGWELFHRLTLPEITFYLDNRAAKGFNVIQAVVLAEFDGLQKPNRYGDLPFKNSNPALPNESYFKLIDSVIQLAYQRGIFIGLLPTWGDKVTRNWGMGPVIFDSLNAYLYGKWIGNRYKKSQNIIWILGGDRPSKSDSTDWTPVWRAMAKGIKEGTENKCIITYHPSGGSYSTSQFLQNESWLDINMIQSGHGGGHDVACWNLIKRDRSMLPAKPTLDAEPNYEDHPVNPWPKWNTDSGYYRAYDVRKQLYRSVFAGACGVTYGHHSIWQFMSAYEEAINYPDRGWINALDRPGASQAGYLKNLIQSRPFMNRIADSTLIMEPAGIKGDHIESFRAADSSFAMIYLPVGRSATLNTSIFKHSEIMVWWFNPRENTIVKGLIEKKPAMLFTTPSLGIGNDWVMIIDDPTFKYGYPAGSIYYNTKK